GKRDAVHRTNVDAGIAFDAELAGEYGLHVAIEAAFGLFQRQIGIIAELDLRLDIAERDHLVAMRHPKALIERDLVVVAPFMDAHLLACHGDLRGRTHIDVLAAAQPVDGDRGFVTVRDRPDDVLGTERGIATEEHSRVRRAHGLGIDLRHVPFVELDAAIALDPRERILLSDRDKNVVAGKVLIGFAGRNELTAAFGIAHRFDLLERDAGQLAMVVGEFLRHQIIENGNVFVDRVLLLPGGRFHLFEARAHDHLNVLAAEPARRAAAIHSGVAAAQHDHTLTDAVDMAERDARQPIDADVDVLGSFLAAGNVKIAPARRAAANKDRVIVLGEQHFETVNALAAGKFNAEVKDVLAFLVEHCFG